MIYHYRCTIRRKCGARKTLKKRIEEYVRRPRCPGCGKDTLKFDPYKKPYNTKNKCSCDGISFPHRKGTEPWCIHAKLGPTEADWKERYR